jgi:K+-transporting ATPase c subunit
MRTSVCFEHVSLGCLAFAVRNAQLVQLVDETVAKRYEAEVAWSWLTCPGSLVSESGSTKDCHLLDEVHLQIPRLVLQPNLASSL